MAEIKPPVGGAFLLGPTVPELSITETIFTPEQFSADARMLASAVETFVRKEVVPVNGRLEAHEPRLMQAILHKAGDLGILGMAVPERYGGLDLPKSQIALLTETAAVHPAFAISASVHSGVATLPLLFFGTPDQKARFLPKLASGEWIGAFALSEANSGSDALRAEARAAIAPDGSHFTLNGAKMWITNGGFADLITCFAQVKGNGFSAFLIERAASGVTAGREEEKLGLRGSSTTRILLDGATVPAENLLGRLGEGRRPALYTLNLGRFGIAATALGMCKESIRVAARYAKERRQFGRAIAEFRMIRAKLAEMAIRTFALESALYRTAGYLDARFEGIDSEASDAQDRYTSAAEEYAIECSVLKVFSSETLDYVVDEALQIHGGYGFSEEYSVAQAYRDARVFRIFEGTNEINRIALVDQLLRRDRTGRLRLLTPAEPPAGDGASARSPLVDADSEEGNVSLSTIERDCFSIRSSALRSLRIASARFAERLMDEQEIVALLADMVAASYTAESAYLRCRRNGDVSPVTAAAVESHTFGARCQCENASKIIEASIASDSRAPIGAAEPDAADSAITHPTGPSTESKRFTPDLVALRRRVASAVVEREGYPW